MEPQKLRFLQNCRVALANFAAVLSISAVFRHLYVLRVLCRKAAEPSIRGAVFYAILSICVLGPGLFALSKLKRLSKTVFEPMLICLSFGIGSTMLAIWISYAANLYGKAMLGVVLIAFAGMGLAGTMSLIRDANVVGYCTIWRRMRNVPLLDLFFLSFALWLAEGVFEMRSGCGFSGLDAVLSWDPWTMGIASRTGIGTHVAGGYPPGIPLLRSVIYKFDYWGDIGKSRALEHILVGGWEMAAFLLMLLLAIGTICRRRGVSPFLSTALLLSTRVIRECLGQVHAGDVDIPFCALISASFGLAEIFNDSLASGWRGRFHELTLAPVFFGAAFAKGTGIVLLPTVLAVHILCERPIGRKTIIKSSIAAILCAMPFYLHQLVVGEWLQCADPNPIMRSHSLRIVWRSLIGHGWSHFAKCAEAFFGTIPGAADASFWKMPAKSLLGPETIILTTLIGILVVLIASRCIRPFAIIALLWLPIWFYCSSYDWRNALVSVFFSALAFGIAAVSISRRLGLAGFEVACGMLLLAKFVGEYISFPFVAWPYRPPAELTRPLNVRMARLSPARWDWNVAEETPWGQRAPCIMTDDPRIFATAGKCGLLQYDLPSEYLHGAMAICGKKTSFPKGSTFLPVSKFGRKGKMTVFFSPASRTSVPFSVSRNEECGSAFSASLDTDIRDGFAVLRFHGLSEKTTVQIAPELLPFAMKKDLFGIFRNDAYVCVPFWLEGTTNALSFIVNPADSGCVLASIEILR